MMKTKINIGIAFIFVMCVYSCRKNPAPGPQSELLKSYLIDGPWQLISLTNYCSSGNISRYQGLVADSVIFGFGPGTNASVNFTSITSFIGGTKFQFGYNIKDSAIICSTDWKIGFSDTLYIKSCSDYSLVFQVRNYSSNPNLNGIEIDSLKKTRFYH